MSTFFSGPFAAECGSLDPVDVSRQQLHLSAGFSAGSNRLFLRETMAEF
jgi:hypothetical protein